MQRLALNVLMRLSVALNVFTDGRWHARSKASLFKFQMKNRLCIASAASRKLQHKCVSPVKGVRLAVSPDTAQPSACDGGSASASMVTAAGAVSAQTVVAVAKCGANLAHCQQPPAEFSKRRTCEQAGHGGKVLLWRSHWHQCWQQERQQEVTCLQT